MSAARQRQPSARSPRASSKRHGRDATRSRRQRSTARREHLAALEEEDERAEEQERAQAIISAASRPRDDEEEEDEVEPEERLARLEARRPRLEAALLAISSIDRAPVETALDSLREGPPTEQVLMPEALDLADQIEAIEHELASLGRVDQFGGEALAAARSRLEAARAELFKAEQAVRVPELSRTDIDELEHAHAEVLQAQDRADSRLGGQRAAKRLTDARDAEQRVLDRLGFNTYADFMMGTSILHIDADAEHRLDVAREELAEAEDEWEHLQADVDAELNRAAVVDRRRALRRRAVDILGFDAGDEIVWALRQHRIQVDTTDLRAARLREALEGVGLALGQERFDDKELVDLTEVWLAEDADTAKRRRIAEMELAEVVDEIFQLRVRIAERAEEGGGGVAVDEEPAVPPAVRRHARLDEARAAVQATEARVARHVTAEREVEERTEALEAASAVERDAAEAIIGAEEAMAAAASAEQAAAAALDEVAARVAAATGLAADAAEALALREDAVRARTAVAPARPAAPSGNGDAVAAAEAVHAAAVEALKAAEEAASSNGAEPATPVASVSMPVDDVEWYLLARLASLRSVSYAGSVPIVLVDALEGLSGADVRRVLDRLERMAASVQVMILTEDDEVAAWAQSVGEDRAAVVTARA